MATISEALALAVEHHQAGRLQAAEQIYRQVLAVAPHHADALHLLGVIAQQMGKPELAVDYIGQAIRASGTEAPFHNNLGAAFKDLGRLDRAVACYRRALELKPDYAAAHNNLGTALKEQGKLDEAVACYRQAALLEPGYVEAHNNLGATLKEQGQLDEALACCRRALELNPHLVEARHNLGSVLQGQGKLDEAVLCYRRVLELKPDSAEALNDLGVALQEQGKLEEAVACHRQVVDRDCRAQTHNSLGKAFSQLAAILRGRLPEGDVSAMRRLLSDANLPDDDRVALQFALAQVFDARGDYDAAAKYLDGANAARLVFLKKLRQDYSSVQYGAFVSDAIATFTPQFFARTGGFGLESEQPLFIVGLPRSGTTLVEQILASHSAVFGAGELHYCDETFRRLPQAMHRGDTPFRCLLDLDRETARRLAQRHLDRLRALAPQALRIVDKMPENYHHLGLIRVLFPQARVIHCRRDLRDVALSCWMTNFTSVPWACTAEDIFSRFEEYSALMDHWRKVLPRLPLDVDYEELVEDTEGVARRILAWCSLEWEPQCLRFHETRRAVQTASAVQVRRPIYKSSLGRWKNYEKPLGALFSRVHQLDAARSERR